MTINSSDVSEKNPASQAGSFAAEFEKYISSGLMETLKVGNIIKGKIVSMNREVVLVDINFKSFGVVPLHQFQDSDGKLTCKVGDEVEVFIIALDSEADQVVLSREKAYQKRVWESVEEAFQNDKVIEGKIIQKVKGGLQVDIGIPAFLPGSQIDIRPHRNLDKFLGEVHTFKVLKVTKDKGNIVLSRRAVLMSERDNLRAETLRVITEGVVMEGTVKNITDYGAFIDLGGIDGLLHITDISWGRINHPADKLSVGETVPVVVLKYDKEKERVSLGMKQLKDDPWQTVHERYPVGGRVTGKVVSLTDYGAFVELEEGVEGLVHVSDMSWTKKVRNPSKVMSEGQEVEAVVLGVDGEQQRLNLGLKQLMPNPWETLHERHPIGSRVSGKVRSTVDFGIFVGVEEGIDGLVHVSDFSWTKKIKDPREIQEMFKKGDDVEALVLDIDIENERLSLGIKQLDSDPWDTIVQRYPVGSKVKGHITSIADFGVFVEVEEGIEGLIHNSQLGLNREQNVNEVYKVGDPVEPEVTNVDREERRISLSLKSIKQREEKDNLAEFTEERVAPFTFGDLLREKIDSSNK
ncbi:MAG: 30S ribosomal protein S1 [Deltaproteobacteria bacterium]|nr:30S ribosomal protein S1 [Deltaproteobacteria bacterium]